MGMNIAEWLFRNGIVTSFGSLVSCESLTANRRRPLPASARQRGPTPDCLHLRERDCSGASFWEHQAEGKKHSTPFRRRARHWSAYRSVDHVDERMSCSPPTSLYSTSSLSMKSIVH